MALGPIRSWSKDKLDLLDKYLRAYSAIMSRQKATWLRSYGYVDAFAGTGKHQDEDSQDFVDGSPAVALKCVPPFDDFSFVEASNGRLGALRQRVRAEFSDRSVTFHQGDANDMLREHVIPRVTKAARRRAFVFLDPYGLEVDFSSVAELGRAGTFDVFVNFSVMGITRLLERGQMPDEATKAIITRVMGGTEWIDGLYTSSTDLFGEAIASRGPLGATRLTEIYVDKLKSQNLFAYVSTPITMTNSRNSPIYVLFLASQNPTAVKITNEIFGRYERLRNSRKVGRSKAREFMQELPI